MMITIRILETNRNTAQSEGPLIVVYSDAQYELPEITQNGG